MGSHRVEGTIVWLSTFDVVGQDGVFAGFIRHSGLVERTGDQSAAAVAVYHMQPPLGAPGEMVAHVIGNAALTDDEVRKIRNFIDKHANEHAAITGIHSPSGVVQCYTILPHAVPFREADGRCVRMRFSCAGFVAEAYERARIHLVREDRLPKVDLELIKGAYPDLARWLDRSEFRESLGLEGDGDWPVLLCGYLFHALNRDADVIRREPYTPEPGDEIFA